MRNRTTGTAAARVALTGLTLTSALALTGCESASGPRDPGGDDKSPASAPAAPTPSWSPVAGPLRTIPAVRDVRPEQGRGWRPGPAARIVVPAGKDSAIADEARLLARELGGMPVAWGRAPVRPGDIELRLTGAPGRPDNAPARTTAEEAYTLTARGTRLTLTAPTDAGLFYGTRTVVQSVRAAGGVPEGTVQDRPDRAQRGLSVDTARKHFTAEWIEARIRESADLKLNQLQLHFSDDQAFRIESASHPEIVSKDHLTKEEVRRLLRLARSLHITVIPELDSPGHLGAVLRAHPWLQLRGDQGAPARGAIDIAQPRAAEIVDELLREYAELFPKERWHLGGDEYRALMARDPEAAYPRLARAAQERYGAEGRVQDLATGWLNDRAKTLRAAGVREIEAWNDGYFRGGVAAPDRDRTVAYWTGKEIGARAPEEYLREGRTVVNLNDEYLYYVLGEPNAFRYPTGERIYKEWTPAVLRGTEPVPKELSGPERVPGARFAVWCDVPAARTAQQVADGIRMPLRALAQKTWDPRPPALSWREFSALAGRVEAGRGR